MRFLLLTASLFAAADVLAAHNSPLLSHARRSLKRQLDIGGALGGVVDGVGGALGGLGADLGLPGKPIPFVPRPI